MPIDKGLYSKISEASLDTPDPKRAERNLLRLFEAPVEKEVLFTQIADVAKLFAVSQFLANYCIANPEELSTAIKELRVPLSKELLLERAETELMPDDEMDIIGIMKSLRWFKKRYLLRITLRDATGETDILSSMDELTMLAETIDRKSTV